MKKDLLRFRDKKQRNSAVIEYLSDDKIEIITMNIFETQFEYSLYIEFEEL